MFVVPISSYKKIMNLPLPPTIGYPNILCDFFYIYMDIYMFLKPAFSFDLFLMWQNWHLIMQVLSLMNKKLYNLSLPLTRPRPWHFWPFFSFFFLISLINTTKKLYLCMKVVSLIIIMLEIYIPLARPYNKNYLFKLLGYLSYII